MCVDGDKDNNDIDSERIRKRYLHDYTRVLLMVGAYCHSEDAVSHHTALDLQAVNKFINPLRDELFGRNKYISAWSIVPATAMVQVLHHGKQVPVCHVKAKSFYWCTGNVNRSSNNMWLQKGWHIVHFIPWMSTTNTYIIFRRLYSTFGKVSWTNSVS